MGKNTSKLLSSLKSTGDIEAWIDEQAEELIDEKSLTQYLGELLNAHDVDKKDVIKRANLDKTYGYQIFQGIRNPSREKLLQIAFAFPLTIDEVKRLLYYGRVGTLYPRVRRDAFLMYALSKSYSLYETNEYLYEHGENTIGTEG